MMERVELTLGLHPQQDTDSSALERTEKLLFEGLLGGAKQRTEELSKNPVELCSTVALCAAGGAALNLMNRAGGRWGLAAKATSGTMALLTAGDVVRRGVPTVAAVMDTWSSTTNLEHDKNVVAAYAGSALVDYPLMMVSGYAGFRGANALPVRRDLAAVARALQIARGSSEQISGNGPYELPPIPHSVVVAETQTGPRIGNLQMAAGYDFPPMARITADSPIANPWTTPMLPRMVNIARQPGVGEVSPGAAYELPPIPRFTFDGAKPIQHLAAQQSRFVPLTVPVDLLRMRH